MKKGLDLRKELDCFEEIWLYKVYTYCKDVQPGMTVFDVGAYYGSFSFYAVAKGAEKAFAVEAQPMWKHQLNRLIDQLDKPETVIFLPIALWFQEQKLRFDFNRVCSQGVEVQGTSLDHVVENYKIRKVDFIKIDTEGSELPIIAGADHTIRRDHPIFAIAAYHAPYYTVDGQWIEKPPPPTITKQSQMDAIIKLFEDRYPEYVYSIKSEGWATGEVITLFV